jgi:hypothetical protein
MITYTSDQFTWKGNHGIAEISQLVSIAEQDSNSNGSFLVVSKLTGKTLKFEMQFDEVGWDGAYFVYNSVEQPEIIITLINA